VLFYVSMMKIYKKNPDVKFFFASNNEVAKRNITQSFPKGVVNSLNDDKKEKEAGDEEDGIDTSMG